MPFIYKRYGKTIEITEIEKKPVKKDSTKIHIRPSRKGNFIYRSRRPDNIRRTKQICVRRLLSALEEFGSPLLVTLTFRGDASDASYANDSLRTFQMRLRIKYPQAQSIFIPELSPKGRIHFHGLLFKVPLHLGDTRQGRRIISYGSERQTRVLANIWREGFVDATKTDGSERLASYMSKYITKNSGETLFNAMRMLRISHGFPKELTIRGRMAEELALRFSKRKPFIEWNRYNIFLGKITKRKYNQDEK